jgi:hypothetical protein
MVPSVDPQLTIYHTHLWYSMGHVLMRRRGHAFVALAADRAESVDSTSLERTTEAESDGRRRSRYTKHRAGTLSAELTSGIAREGLRFSFMRRSRYRSVVAPAICGMTPRAAPRTPAKRRGGSSTTRAAPSAGHARHSTPDHSSFGPPLPRAPPCSWAASPSVAWWRARTRWPASHPPLPTLPAGCRRPDRPRPPCSGA